MGRTAASTTDPIHHEPRRLKSDADDAVIRHGMTHRVGAKGQVVIPKDLRDELGIEPGDEVTFWRQGDHVAVRPALRSRFAGTDLVAVLAAERAADRERESKR